MLKGFRVCRIYGLQHLGRIGIDYGFKFRGYGFMDEGVWGLGIVVLILGLGASGVDWRNTQSRG